MLSKILIVDDSEAFREVLRDYVRTIFPDMHIDEAENAFAALDMIKEGNYDCVFLDYALPDLNGISVLHGVFEQQSGIQLPPPIIMVTASKDDKVITAAIKAGALDFITKDTLNKDTLFLILTKAEQYFAIRKSQLQAEERLLQVQKMESVGLLAGGIAHDFNNLLTVIFGNVKFLSRGFAKLPEEYKDLNKHIDAIDRAARRGSGLVKRLMIFSRQRTLEAKQIDLNVFLQDMFILLSHSIGVSIELQAEYAEDLWPVFMDETQLGSAIMNMAVNARDAMPDGGSLSFQTQNMEVTRQMAEKLPDLEPGKYVVLSIRDTGHGMSEEIMGRIFEPFFTTKDIGKGTGLGLSMVYGLIRESGGTLTVESEKGKGTCFHMYLPKSHQLEATLPETLQKGSHSMKGRETILIVEDEEDIRSLAVDILKAQEPIPLN